MRKKTRNTVPSPLRIVHLQNLVMTPNVICYRYRCPGLVVRYIRKANVERTNPIRDRGLSCGANKGRINTAAKQRGKWNITFQLPVDCRSNQFLGPFRRFRYCHCIVGRDPPLMISLRTPRNSFAFEMRFQYLARLKRTNADVKSLRCGNVKERREVLNCLSIRLITD